MEVLPNDNKQAVDVGLKYVNNARLLPIADRRRSDALDAILSGKYDTDRLAIVTTQTGGGCRLPTTSDLSGAH